MVCVVVALRRRGTITEPVKASLGLHGQQAERRTICDIKDILDNRV